MDIPSRRSFMQRSLFSDLDDFLTYNRSTDIPVRNFAKSPKSCELHGQQWCITIRYSNGSNHTSRRRSSHLSSTTSLSARSDDRLSKQHLHPSWALSPFLSPFPSAFSNLYLPSTTLAPTRKAFPLATLCRQGAKR